MPTVLLIDVPECAALGLEERLAVDGCLVRRATGWPTDRPDGRRGGRGARAHRRPRRPRPGGAPARAGLRWFWSAMRRRPDRVAALTCGADVCLADTETEPGGRGPSRWRCCAAGSHGSATSWRRSRSASSSLDPPGPARPGGRAPISSCGPASSTCWWRWRAPRGAPSGATSCWTWCWGPRFSRRGQHRGRPHLLAAPEAARRGAGPDHHPARGRLPAGRAEPAGCVPPADGSRPPQARARSTAASARPTGSAGRDHGGGGPPSTHRTARNRRSRARSRSRTTRSRQWRARSRRRPARSSPGVARRRAAALDRHHALPRAYVLVLTAVTAVWGWTFVVDQGLHRPATRWPPSWRSASGWPCWCCCSSPAASRSAARSSSGA